MSEKFQVDCRGVPASVEVVGRGPVVVMVGATVPMAWDRPSCVELGYTVLNFDYEPPDGWDREPEPRSALDQTEDVVAVMAATGLAMAHVVGLSRGAITAYGLAAMHSELVETLTLVCPVAGFGNSPLRPPKPLSSESVPSPAHLIRPHRTNLEPVPGGRVRKRATGGKGGDPGGRGKEGGIGAYGHEELPPFGEMTLAFNIWGGLEEQLEAILLRPRQRSLPAQV